MAHILSEISKTDERNILGIKKYGALCCAIRFSSGEMADGVITVSKEEKDRTVWFLVQTPKTDSKGNFYVYPFCICPHPDKNDENTLCILPAADCLPEDRIKKLIRRQKTGIGLHRHKFLWGPEIPEAVFPYKKIKLLDHKTFEEKYF